MGFENETGGKNQGKPFARRNRAFRRDYCVPKLLPTCEKTVLALLPISLTVPITMTKITASMTAYSATS